MENRIREHVEYLFRSAPLSAQAMELREELIDNLTDRYRDLVNQGETEDSAYAVAIAGIGDVGELIRGLWEEDIWNPAIVQEQRQKSALLVAAAVGLFIASPIFLILGNYFSYYVFSTYFFETIGRVLALLCTAAGVALLVFNAKSKPKYVKAEDTIVEDFKEWSVKGRNRKSLNRTVQSLIWTATVPLYLIIGFFFGAWHPGWLIFVLAPFVSQVVRLILLTKEDEHE